MPSGHDPGPAAVAELVRVLREQVAKHTDNIADLENRLSAAHQRISEQQRLLARLLDNDVAPRSNEPFAPPLAYHAESQNPSMPPCGYPASEGTPAAGPRFPVTSTAAAAMESLQPASQSRKPDPMFPGPATAESPGASVPHSVPHAVQSPIAFVSAPGQDVRETAGNTSTRLKPEPAGVKLGGQTRVEHIDVIASAVFQARLAQHDVGDNRRSQRNQDSVAHTPTIGVVRAVAAVPIPSMPGARETTLTIDREALDRGHRSLAGRRRWFFFGRR